MEHRLRTLRANLAGLALVLALAFALLPPRTAYAAGYANPGLLMETSALAGRLGDENLRVIDVRPQEAYAKGHIPGAVHLGADDVIDPDSHVGGHLLPDSELAARLGELGIDRNTEVVLYDDNGGFHAARLFWMLEYFGHRKASVLNGGIPKWMKEDRKLSDASPTVMRKTFALNLTPRRMASADWLLDHRGDTSSVLIDVRPVKMYKEGHIPWALSIPWKQNLTPNATMKPAEALLAHFSAQGVTPGKNVAVHCQNGKAAAHTYFTLRLLGFPRVRSYDRSWAEWGAADDLPKAKE